MRLAQAQLLLAAGIAGVAVFVEASSAFADEVGGG